MKKRSGKARAARFAMLAAAFLAAGASFGLHPEPQIARADGSPILECAHSPSAAPEAHDCLACRAHRPLVAARTNSGLSTPRPSVPHRPLLQPVLPRPGAPSRCDGRAPPEPA